MAPYSSTFPASPAPDPDDMTSVAGHDQTSFDGLSRMFSHWERPHRRSIHWMLTFGDQPEVCTLAQQCQHRLPKEGLDLIEPEGLHLTVRRFGYADTVPAHHLHTAVQTLRDGYLRTAAPFKLQIVPLAGSPGAVRFSVAPWSPLLELFVAVSAVSGHHHGDPLTVYRPHLSIAYSNREQHPERIQDAVRQARELPSTEATVSVLRLVELYRRDHQYRWRVLEDLLLESAEH
ncbi:2'-5' RNA ligase family protein [Saccharopolyspora shandongensis]|uniref:2'-5' RNA ligase family protein n=1 Tax=Saccharopolyspora shandongensis TaxID=418495 RepID=UPI0034048920